MTELEILVSSRTECQHTDEILLGILVNGFRLLDHFGGEMKEMRGMDAAAKLWIVL